MVWVFYMVKESPTYFIIFIFIIIRLKNSIQQLFYKEKNICTYIYMCIYTYVCIHTHRHIYKKKYQ